MPLEILIMIGAFLAGILFDFLRVGRKLLLICNKSNDYADKATSLRTLLYRIAVFYLLFKIGFSGGSAAIGESWQAIVIPSIIVVIAASFWTLFVLLMLSRWSTFNRITQVSIAAHFGSVSVGTFIAAIAFLDAMEIDVDPGVAIWLAFMELPAVFIGMWKLGIRANTILPILKEEWSLAVLPVSIVLGMLISEAVPASLSYVFFNILFMPILLYFLFEMGRKASDSIAKIKKQIDSVFLVGIVIPIIGGFFGTSMGYWLGYDTGKMFILAILMASASYVLAPLCMQEILKSIYKPKPEIAKQVVSTSMALSVGITLPFNIIIGFELYYLMIQGMQASPRIAVFGLALPFVLGGISLLCRPRSSSPNS